MSNHSIRDDCMLELWQYQGHDPYVQVKSMKEAAMALSNITDQVDA